MPKALIPRITQPLHLKLFFGFLLTFFFLGISPCFSQEDPTAPVQTNNNNTGGGLGGDDPFWRLGILELMSPRFDRPHPFRQMTGSPAFENPQNVNINLSTNYRTRIRGQENATLQQQLVDVLPPFFIEYVTPFESLWPMGFSLTYYHTTSFELDSKVANTLLYKRAQIPFLKMKIYYDIVGGAIHPFGNPGEPGIDISFGSYVANIQGLYEGGFRGSAANNYTRIVNLKRFGQFPVPVRRVAIDSNGDTFGFRFALWIIEGTVVIDEDENAFFGNPQAPNAQKEIVFAGVLLQLAMTWKF